MSINPSGAETWIIRANNANTMAAEVLISCFTRSFPVMISTVCNVHIHVFHSSQFHQPHYDDFIMTTIASQITSLTSVYSTIYSDADQRKHQSSASLAFVWGIHRDRWIPRTEGQLRGKCFHLMTSSWWCISVKEWCKMRIYFCGYFQTKIQHSKG